MDFLIRSRAFAHAEDTEDDPSLNERHWSYMDDFADRMTARGPTLGRDRETWTGSLHVVDLDGALAAREFAEREPYHQAGLFEEHFIWQFTNLLGRTMWQYERPPDEPRFLVLARGAGDPPSHLDLPPQLSDGLIMFGALRDLDDQPAGLALAVQVPSREALDALLGDVRTGLADHDVEVHDWEFGGRR